MQVASRVGMCTRWFRALHELAGLEEALLYQTCCRTFSRVWSPIVYFPWSGHYWCDSLVARDQCHPVAALSRGLMCN